MKQIEVGKIVGIRGVSGEMKIFHYTDHPDFFCNMKTIYCGNALMNIEYVKSIGKSVVMRLEGISTIEEAQALIGVMLFINEEDLPPLPQGRYYIRELIGVKVFDEQDCLLGTISDVISSGAGNLYEILLQNGKTALIPAVDEFIKKVDLAHGRVDVKLIEGLIE